MGNEKQECVRMTRCTHRQWEAWNCFRVFYLRGLKLVPNMYCHMQLFIKEFIIDTIIPYSILFVNTCSNATIKKENSNSWTPPKSFIGLKAKHLTSFWFAFLMIWCPSRATGEPNSDQQGEIAWLIGSDRNLGRKQPHTKDNYKKVTWALKHSQEIWSSQMRWDL